MKTLDALVMPLNGSTLIEASAGTGKTYTITTLFIRLLLEKRVSVDQILVVTFTIAATEELRLKIAARLNEAIDILRGANSNDETLVRLLAGLDRSDALATLSDVASRLDEVAVYTIDAMCLRVINDYAFDSDSPLQMDFIANDEYIRRQAAEDYWRTIIGSKDYLATDEILAFNSPQALLDTVEPLLRAPDARVIPSHNREDAENLRRSLNKSFFRALSIWETSAAEIVELLRTADGLNGNSYRVATLESLFQETADKFSTEKLPAELPKKFHLFTQSELNAKTNKGGTTPQHEFFMVCESLLTEFESYRVQRRAVALTEAAGFIRKRIDDYKTTHGLLHFEDLRIRLSAALSLPSGSVLADKVRNLWPYALVDEAQDTDPQQNRIFHRIYSGFDECGLYYIGDPKQAIYGFRGADVFTYMSAAKAFENRYTLGVNWRSSSAMVDAVNLLFSKSDNPFVFKGDISYRKVAAAGAADDTTFLVQNEAVPALQFRYLDEAEAESTDVYEDVALRCAKEIATLIAQGRAKEACIGDTPLVASDIAVLVKSHDQGRKVQMALSRLGVKSATQGGKTVFDSDEAGQLQTILNAIAYPGIVTVRRAVVTRVIGKSASVIDQYNNAEDGWDALTNRFYEYRSLWQSHSLMAAVQTLFRDSGIAEIALTDVGGERRLTNLIQLTEILQLKSRELASIDQLLDWLEVQIEQKTHDDELVQRLESDEDLVQIVTIHKSKGLEYPVVFLPFCWTVGAGSSRSAGVTCFHDRQNFQSVIDLGSIDTNFNRLLSKEEDFSESLRLLYVALTRAKYHCVIGWHAAGGARSALAYLLHDAAPAGSPVDFKVPKEPEFIQSQVATLAGIVPGSMECSAWNAGDARVLPQHQFASLAKREFKRSIDRHWRITSYTGLQSGEDSGLPDHDVSAADTLADEQAFADDLGLIGHLPAGARTGQILHEILEVADFNNDEHVESSCVAVSQRYGGMGSDEDWQPVITEIVRNTISTVIDEHSQLRLADLSATDRINEMEFFFALTDASARTLVSALSPFDQYRGVADGLGFSSIFGLMRGFIDLVGRKDNRYFIVDYKSNWLGNSRAHYQRPQLGEAIRSHRYDLQYLIYMVALHRYLKARMGDRYDYDRDVSGVYYLFLRGLKPGHPHGIWHDKPSREVIERLDACFSGRLVS